MKLHPTKSLSDSLKSVSEKPSIARKPCLKPSASQKKLGNLSVRRVSMDQLRPSSNLDLECDTLLEAESKRLFISQVRTANNTIAELCAEMNPKTVMPTNSRKKEWDVLAALNESLSEKLKPLESQSDLRSRFLAFQEVFAAVISLDPTFSVLLLRIKSGYEEIIAQLLDSSCEQSVSALTKQLHDSREFLRLQQREKDDLSASLSKLKKDNQSYMVRVSELTALCRSKEKQLRDVLSGGNQCKPSSLSEMVKTLQTEVQILKTRETMLLSAVGVGHGSAFYAGKVMHKKSHSTSSPLSKRWMPRLTSFENQHTAGSISPIGHDWDGFMWEGSTIEGQEKPEDETANA